MSDETTIALEIPAKNRNDTRRSWIALLKLVSGLSFCLAAIIGFISSYSEYSVNGNSQAETSGFQSSLTSYVTESSRASFSTLGLDFDQSGFNPLLEGSSTPADENGHASTAQLKNASQRLAVAFKALSPLNRDCAKEAMKNAEEYDRKLLLNTAFAAPWDDRFDNLGWKMKTTPLVLAKCIGIAALSGFCVGIVAWLLVVALAFIWWFFIDRLRDIARAVKVY